MRRGAGIVRPSYFVLAALVYSFAISGPAFAQAPPVPPHSDTTNAARTQVNPVALNAVPANIHFDVVLLLPGGYIFWRNLGDELIVVGVDPTCQSQSTC
jgi:hypothetical protein